MKRIFGYIISGIGLILIGYGINMWVHQTENYFLVTTIGVTMVMGIGFYFKRQENNKK